MLRRIIERQDDQTSLDGFVDCCQRRLVVSHDHELHLRHEFEGVLPHEPSGDLDRQSAEEILTLMERLNTEFKKTIIMVTHDPHAADRAKTKHHLDKGELILEQV